ncbi:chaperone protein dnaJ 11, chloroplastic [Selaginella moellendorffii]|nr:chaperone protein dnaJ 11, chloroplastic [Selaginella moellendorffii]|eukprot:XP_002980885.2 chaperone protein dnaJ 11, chloroplastic [Selaginella moellendorffii]
MSAILRGYGACGASHGELRSSLSRKSDSARTRFLYSSFIRGGRIQSAKFSTLGLACSSQKRSLYEILGIGLEASDFEIKEAYRRLAKVYHPDLAPPELWPQHQGKFLEVQRAYDVLKDRAARAEYDSQMQKPGGLEGLDREWRGFNWETDQCW